MKYINNNFGFSLIQVLLVISIMLLLVSMAVPSLYQLQSSAQIDTISAEIAQNLRRAEARAMVGYNNTDWGVYFTDNTYTIFSGDSYALRDENKDEDFTIASSIELVTDFANEMVFTKPSGLPNTSGQIVLTNNVYEEAIIDINSLGVIEYR